MMYLTLNICSFLLYDQNLDKIFDNLGQNKIKLDKRKIIKKMDVHHSNYDMSSNCVIIKTLPSSYNSKKKKKLIKR